MTHSLGTAGLENERSPIGCLDPSKMSVGFLSFCRPKQQINSKVQDWQPSSKHVLYGFKLLDCVWLNVTVSQDCKNMGLNLVSI